MARFSSSLGALASQFWAFVGLAALVAIAIAAYWPGLNGPFLFDDIVNFVNNEMTMLVRFDVDGIYSAAFSSNESYPRRGLAFVSFALNYLVDGGRYDAFSMKVTNLAIHLVNACLVYLLARALYAQRCAACGLAAPGAPVTQDATAVVAHACALSAAALWALHPIQITSVLYVVQRMTSLSGTFVLLGVLSYVLARRSLPGRPYVGACTMTVTTVVCTVAGVLCKENAALLPFLIGGVEWFFFDRKTLPARARQLLVAYVCCLVFLPAALVGSFLVINWDVWLLGGYGSRDFTLEQRLLTQCRVLLEYLRWLMAPSGRSFGIFHDDIALSSSLLSPPGTIVAVVTWGVVVVAAVYGARRKYFWSFGVFWYLVAHSMESSIIPLELVYEHRNYIPSFGVVVCVSWYAMLGLRRWVSSGRLRMLVAVLPVALIAFLTLSRASVWSSEVGIMAAGVRNHPESARYHAERGTRMFWYEGDLAGALRHLLRASEIEPGNVATLLFMYKMVAYRELVEEGEYDGFFDGEAALPGELKAKIRANWPIDDAVELKQYLGREIDDRLATLPMQAATVVVLAQVSECARNGTAACARFAPKIREWIETALTNSRITGDVYGHLAMMYGQVLFSSGEPQLALDYVRRAVREHPDRSLYRLILAEGLVEAGRLDEAGRHARILWNNRARNAPLLRRIDSLHERLGGSRDGGTDGRRQEPQATVLEMQGTLG